MRSIALAIFIVGLSIAGEMAHQRGLTYETGGWLYAMLLLFALIGFAYALVTNT